MALGRFKKKSAALKSNGKLKKGCRFLKGGRISCKTKPRPGGGWRAAKKRSTGRKAGLKANGRLKKGCRFAKGGRVICKGAARRRRRRS